MKIITVEEHIPGGLIKAAAERYAAQDAPYRPAAGGRGLPLTPDLRLFDLNQARVADMDAHGITMQVVSCPGQSQYIPPEEGPSIVAEANDQAAEACRAWPGRFALLASLPWSVPAAAARELERAVTKLGCKGAILSGRASAGPAFLDDPAFTPVLEALQALGVPLYLHPAPPLLPVQRAYYDGLGEQVSARLSLYGWGWHQEAGVQLVRLMLAGALEKFPRLQVIAGHWGEMVPFFLARLDQTLPPAVTGLERTLTETFRQQVYVTPSGMFDQPHLLFCRDVLGADRILHSVDHPFLRNEGARAFLEEAPLSPREREQIAHKNAEVLFGL